MSSNYIFYKQNETDSIYRVKDPNKIGRMLFSYDKKKIYNIFKDYPQNLTKEQKALFDKENPFWADFFKSRELE